MNGFSQDFATATITGRLFRKADMANFIREGELCFSTEKSIQLIGQGNIALVIEPGNYEGEYVDGDGDAGKNYGYDEFRVEFTRESLQAAIEAIVIPDSLYDSDDADDWDILENLRDYGFVMRESEATIQYNINFNF